MWATRVRERSTVGRTMEWIVTALTGVVAVPVTLWVAGAVYYDLCGGAKWGRLAVAGWVGGVAVLFLAWQPVWQPFAVLSGLTGLFLTWWLRLKPSHDRNWDASVATLPRVQISDDILTFEFVRNFEYRSLGNFTPRYETRAVRLSRLQGVDLILFNWGLRYISHPVLVFDFGPDGRICLSIEVRYRKGQDFAILRSFYRQQELIFLVLDERDAILRRTKYGRPHTVRLYHLTVSRDVMRTTLLDYVAEINKLHDRPRWYHGLCANCTTSFYRLPNSRLLRDCRVIANSRLDSALYDYGRLDQSLPFEELRRLALINDIANDAPEDGFGDFLRRELDRRIALARAHGEQDRDLTSETGPPPEQETPP